MTVSADIPEVLRYLGMFVLVVLGIFIVVRVATAAYFKSRNQFHR